MRSGAHVWWEAAMERGARDAELRVITEIMRPFMECGRQVGIAFREAGVRMSSVMDAYSRAMSSSQQLFRPRNISRIRR